MDIFILYELVKISALSAPCHPGSRPKGYTCPVFTRSTMVALSCDGSSQPEWKRCKVFEKMSLYMSPVYIEKAPMRRMM